jgi:hypothetical protein
MKRIACLGMTLMFAGVVATSAYSQTQRPRVRATRRTVPPQTAQPQFGGMSSMGPMDPNMTPPQQMAQHQQDFQQRMAQMQAHMQEMQRQAEESRQNSIRQLLGATEEQWVRIKTKLDLIDRLKGEASVCADLGSSTGGGMTTFQSSGPGFSGGGFSGGMMAGGGMMSSSGQPQTWSQSSNMGSPSSRRNAANPSDGEVLCDQLLRDLQSPGTPPTEIAQRVAALRRIRTQAEANLARARKDLRAMISPAQEPALVLLGYLD